MASVSVSITFALFVITVRIMNATKGRMPLALLTPIPTPMGDFSGLIVVFWQADALLVTAMVGFFVTVEWLSLPLLVLLLVGAGAAALVMARRNLQNAR